MLYGCKMNSSDLNQKSDSDVVLQYFVTKFVFILSWQYHENGLVPLSQACFNIRLFSELCNVNLFSWKWLQRPNSISQ